MQDEGVWPEAGLVGSGSESTNCRILKERVVCNRPQENGGRLQEYGKILRNVLLAILLGRMEVVVQMSKH